MSGYLPTVGSDPALVLSPLPPILRGQSGAERSGLSLDERVGETGDGVAQHHLPAFGLINGKWLCAFEKAEHQRRFCLTEVGFLFFGFCTWSSGIVHCSARQLLLHFWSHCSWLLLSPDWLRVLPLSWLQQTGNAPQQVMLQALFRCVARCSRGETWLITVAPSFHLLPQCLLFLQGDESSQGAEP